jgi:5-methylcytosine-specific restriction endonuclease McrBC regulatory subunit McrC
VSAKRNDVVFLCVDLGDEKAVIENYWKEKGFTMRAVRQHDSAVSDAFQVLAYPTNYLIGPDGKVLWREMGWNEAALRELLLK